MIYDVPGALRKGVLTGLSLVLLASGSTIARAETVSEQPMTGRLDVTFDGLRSTRGYLRACLTQNRTHYPKCERDPVALTASVAAGNAAHLSFANVPPGNYALLIFHDENGNSRLDTMLGIPREGVGFSHNPKLRFGAPSFDKVMISVPAGSTQETAVKLQYFL